MTKKERKLIGDIECVLGNIICYHNKNLTKTQYYAIENCVETIKVLFKEDNKRLFKRFKSQEEMLKYLGGC